MSGGMESMDWDEKRMDVVGQNGNVGYSIDDATPADWDALRSNRAKVRASRGALDVQISGNHYKDFKIQPVEFIYENKIPFIEGCAIKYLCRWEKKGGIKDLEKAKHFIDLLIQFNIEKE